MRVSRTENQRMLQDKGCDPHVIGRDRSTLLTKLAVDGRVVMGGLLVWIKYANARLEKKSAQNRFVARSLVSNSEASPQFPQNDEG